MSGEGGDVRDDGEVEVDENGNAKYQFITNDGIRSVAKSPRGCFEDKLIPNDLQYVLNKIKEYEKK